MVLCWEFFLWLRVYYEVNCYVQIIIFFFDGCLYQVEYVFEVIFYVGIVIGILVKDGIVFVVECKVIFKLFEQDILVEKFYIFNEYDIVMFGCLVWVMVVLIWFLFVVI